MVFDFSMDYESCERRRTAGYTSKIREKSGDGSDHQNRPLYESEQDDKPGYVVNGHLSRPAVASRLERPTWS